MGRGGTAAGRTAQTAHCAARSFRVPQVLSERLGLLAGWVA